MRVGVGGGEMTICTLRVLYDNQSWLGIYTIGAQSFAINSLAINSLAIKISCY